MKTYRVEYNDTGSYYGAGVWICLDETAVVEAETAQEAIELVIDWLEADEPECHNYAWRAAERTETEYGIELSEWENEEG